jgi:hypothetical protein
MDQGTLEGIITGEVELTSMSVSMVQEESKITDKQRDKCIEIGKYIKRLYIRKKKEIEYHK